MLTSQLKRLIRTQIRKCIRALPPDKVLQFLFQLDNQLYVLQSHMAIVYGGGIHTKHRHMNYHDFFVERIQAGEQVLDIGCGTGVVAYDVAERVQANVVGIDLEPANIVQAQQYHAHPRIAYCIGDALDRFLSGSFDVVILSNVLEHLPNRPLFLRRLQQTVAPSRFLIRVPLFERDWRVPLKQELGVEWRLDLTHETEYTLESFAEEMKVAGLRITYQEIRWGEIWAEITV